MKFQSVSVYSVGGEKWKICKEKTGVWHLYRYFHFGAEWGYFGKARSRKALYAHIVEMLSW